MHVFTGIVKMRMGTPLTKRSIDNSNPDAFLFSFYCDRCGKEWQSLPLPFTLGGFTAIEHDETWKLVWEQEHKAAFMEANLKAQLSFNYCSSCGKWVCDACFNHEAKEQCGLCKDCNAL